MLLAWFLDRRISRPIEYLTEQADKVSMGNLLNPIDLRDATEIGRLGEAFERMRVSMVRAIEHRRRA
nr:HAMP domain-containing protein [Sedimenticola hydrogenitrophicus]